MNPLPPINADQTPHLQLTCVLEQTGEADWLIGQDEFDGTATVPFGRIEQDDWFYVEATTDSSRHMGTFVPVDGSWWLVVPVHNPGEAPKRSVEIFSSTSRTTVTVPEGGWHLLPPGDTGTIRPYTINGAVIRYQINNGQTPIDITQTARRTNEQEPDTTRQQPHSRNTLGEDGPQWAGPTEASADLSSAALNFIHTAAWFRWTNQYAPFLSLKQVATIWNRKEDSVRKRIQDELASWCKTHAVESQLSWVENPEFAFKFLSQAGVLRQYDHDWLNLDYEQPQDVDSDKRLYPGDHNEEELTNFNREGREFHPPEVRRRSENRPSGWAKEQP